MANPALRAVTNRLRTDGNDDRPPVLHPRNLAFENSWACYAYPSNGGGQIRDPRHIASSKLQSLGFIRAKRGESLVLTYPNGGPVILLPAYKSGEAVKPIHRIMVNRQLMDAGIF